MAWSRLGRLWGSVVASSGSREGVEEQARRLGDDRLVLLETGRRSRGAAARAHDGEEGATHVVVDVRGCVFEYANHADEGEEACNLRVSPGGYVDVTRDVRRGEELRWDYGDASFVLC